MMKKILFWVLVLWFSFVNLSFAENFLDLWDFLTVYFEWISEDIPESYEYIDVKYSNIKDNSILHNSLQKWIYLN